MDDDLEAAPIYHRSDGKAGQPVIRPHENHDLHMKQEPTQMESQQKQQAPSKAVGYKYPKSRECDEHTWFIVRLRIGPVTASLKEMTDLQLKDNSHLILQSHHVHIQIGTQGTERFSPLKKCMHRRHVLPHQRTHANGLD